MKNTKEIEIYVVDNDILFLEEFEKKFSHEKCSNPHTFSSVQNFLSELHEQNDNNFSIVIINDMIISHGLNTKSVVEILPMIKNIDKEISVIILTDNDNRELKISSSDLRPNAFIKKDKMLYMKLTPTLNRIISRYELKKNIRTLHIIFIIAIIIIVIAIAYFSIASILD